MDSILYWNAVALEANRLAHTVGMGGRQTGPTLSSRAMAIVHLAMHDAYFGVNPPVGHTLYLPGATSLPPGGNTAAAVAAAACATLTALEPAQTAAFEKAVAEADIPEEDAHTSRAYGLAVAAAILDKLAIKPGEPGADDAHYWPSDLPCHHRPDPDNPGQGFHGPYYGATSPWIAVSQDHVLDPPPKCGHDDYKAALEEVRAKGGAPYLPTTERTPEESLIGIYWGYDGANEIGTPPRLYNQIIRDIAMKRNNSEAQNARLLALVNAAMGDAGIFSWKEKYRYDLWRPVLGIREHDGSMGPTGKGSHAALDPCCDPWWLPLGAPASNSMDKNFTPPFPAYPSGHATFGAAAFQMVRLFYGCPADQPDDIAFTYVSDELNGKTRDNQKTIRPRHERKFKSLWEAIFENGLSRVFLGVHWSFDAFDARDVKDRHGGYKDPAKISYDHKVGGVPLGLAIANDIWQTKLVCSPGAAMAAASVAMPAVALQKTSYSR